MPSTGGTVSQEASNLQVQDNKGAVNFSLPLPELPSRGPLMGSLALTYNQFQGGEGTGLGVGWSWDVPSIETNDDFGTALRGRDATGRFLSHFTYQGKRLVFIRNDGDNEVYQPESDDKPLELVYFKQPQEYLLVDHFNSITSKTLNHHFEVRYPDGTKEIYSGEPGEAEGVFQGSEPFINRWPLRLRLKNIPRFGRNAYNAVEYLYQKAGERSYLKSVVFAGGASRYEFDFYDKDQEQLTTTVEDPETGELIDKSLGAVFPGKTSSLKSYEQRDPLLYTRVRSIHNGQDLNQWCFVHQMVNRFNGSFRILTHDSCKQKALGEIRTYMNDQSIAVQNQLKAIYRTAPMTAQRPAVTEQTPREATLFFDYSDWMNSRRKLKVNGEDQSLATRPLVFDVASQIEAIGSLGLDAYSLTDYNQDSIVDLVYSGDAETKVFLGSGDLAQSFQTSSTWQIESVSGSGAGAMVSPNFRTATHQFADVNGDSFVDVLEWKAPGQFLVFYGDGKGAYEKGPADLIIGPAIKGTSSLFQPNLADFRSGRVSLIDLNDDGRTDVLGSYRLNGVLKAVQCLATPGTTQLGCSQSNFPAQDIGDAGFNDPSLRLNDLNGDGLVDLVQFKIVQGEKGYCFFANSGLSHQAAAQGIFGHAHGEAACSGNGRFFAVSELSSNDSLLNFWSIDANGDGINDLVKATDGIPSASQSQLTIWMGMGDGSVTNKPRLYVLKTKLGLSQDQNSGVKFADIDADGQKEILLFKKVGTQSTSVRVLDFNRIGESQLPRSNLLISIEYESGLRHDMRYATSADEFLRDQDVRDADEVAPLHFPAVVLKQLATSEGTVGGQRVDVEAREYVYHRPFFDPIDRRFQGFGEVDVIEYGDGKTEQSRLTRNYYHQGSTLEQRALSGRLSHSSSYEYKPLSSSEEAGPNPISATLDPTDAELNSMSQYARHQGELCGALVGSGRNYERCTLRLRQIVGWETSSRNTDGGTLFVRRASSSEEVFDPAADARTTSSCRVPTVAGASNVTRTHTLFDPELNLPTVMEEIQERLNGPFAISMPKRTVRTTYAYKDFPELGILGLVDSRETWVSTEGDAEEKLSERLVNSYYPDSAWLASAKTEIYSSLDQVPAELEDKWKAEQEQIVSITYNDVGTVTSTDEGLGKVERLVYDDQGINLLQTINPAGETYTYSYDSKGRVRTYTTPLGLVNTLDYDELNRRKSLTTSMGYQETYAYKL
ncbi:MAG: FG-GAP-like repeat-containing protein, partial [Pseudobdellovibrionaceae bacterium]|nr:FG-GAP-like repeat-containing protein [Pseudobdellovibrionaceae bacterium]